MGRHIVGSLVPVSIPRIAVGNETCKECIEVMLDIGIRVFLNDEGRGCVVQKNMADPNANAGRCDDVLHCSRNEVQSAAGCIDVKDVLMHTNDVSHP